MQATAEDLAIWMAIEGHTADLRKGVVFGNEVGGQKRRYVSLRCLCGCGGIFTKVDGRNGVVRA